MDFDDFADGVPNEDDVHDMFETMVWQPAPERTEFSTLLQQPFDRLVGLHEDGKVAASTLFFHYGTSPRLIRSVCSLE